MQLPIALLLLTGGGNAFLVRPAHNFRIRSVSKVETETETTTASSTSPSSSSSSSFDTTALKECLTREYTGFFSPMELEFYDEAVSFVDPLTTLSSVEAYKNNVDLLAGRTPLGAFLFRDAGIELHGVEDTGPGALRTRWTLEMTMKALPWQPTAYFSGVSDYEVDTARGVIVGQKDYWDSLNLGEGGKYEKKDLFSGLKDFVGQLAPSNPEKSLRQSPGAQRKDPLLAVLPYSLLRRGRGYDVRRYPGRVCIARVAGDASGAQAPTSYGPLGAFLRGAANDKGVKLQAYGPTITTTIAPASASASASASGASSASSVTTDVPILYGDSTLPTDAPVPTDSSGGVSITELGWSSSSMAGGEEEGKGKRGGTVVAVRRFSPGDPEAASSSAPPERLVDEHRALLKALKRDGLAPLAEDVEVIRRATYDASATGGAAPEVWVPLASHDWE